MEWSRAGFLSALLHVVLILNLALFFYRSNRDANVPEPVLNCELPVEEVWVEPLAEIRLDHEFTIPENRIEEVQAQSPAAIANIETAELPDVTAFTTLPDLNLRTSHTRADQALGEGGKSLQSGDGVDFSDGDGVGGDEGWSRMIKHLRQNGLDIVIVFDSTGSMGGEIGQVKDQMRRIGEALLKLVPATQISLCTYRDRSDVYVVQGLPLTNQLREIDQFLAGISAGGDRPEAVDEGLRWAVENNRFRRNARKVILLFGDAPPHAGRFQDCLAWAASFRSRQRGFVSTVTCRSHTRIGEFQQIARAGGGEAFLTTDERQIMKQLLILVFGSKYQDDVLKAFDLADKQNNSFRPETPNFRRNPVRFRSK